MSEDTQVSDGESEETTITTENSESPTTPAGAEESSSSEPDAGETTDKADTAFDETLLETEGEPETPPPTKTEEKDAHANKQVQVDKWVSRFDGRNNPKTNEPYVMDDIPHDWLKQEVSDQLHELDTKPAPDPKPQLDKNELFEDFEFSQLKKRIPDLPKSKQKELATNYKSLKDDGVRSNFKALTRALNQANIEVEAERRGKKAAYMNVPGGGGGGGIEGNSGVETNSSKAMRKSLGISDDKKKKSDGYDFMKTLNPPSQ